MYKFIGTTIVASVALSGLPSTDASIPGMDPATQAKLETIRAKAREDAHSETMLVIAVGEDGHLMLSDPERVTQYPVIFKEITDYIDEGKSVMSGDRYNQYKANRNGFTHPAVKGNIETHVKDCKKMRWADWPLSSDDTFKLNTSALTPREISKEYNVTKEELANRKTFIQPADKRALAEGNSILSPLEAGLSKDGTSRTLQEAGISFGDYGPENPFQLTGIKGRGLLGKYGPNHAADPIVTRINPTTKKPEFVAVQRSDTGHWAIPGGMIDDLENPISAAVREFIEEAATGLNQAQIGEIFDMGNAKNLYTGICADEPRNTDNAWMETSVYLFHISNPATADNLELTESAEKGETKTKARWLEMSEDNIKNLYASHPHYVRLALQSLKDDGLIDDHACKRRRTQYHLRGALAPTP